MTHEEKLLSVDSLEKKETVKSVENEIVMKISEKKRSYRMKVPSSSLTTMKKHRLESLPSS